MEPPAEGGEVGGQRELVQNWFTHTQAPLILLQNGQFPDWFQGFSSRKDAEEQLKDKPLGCFLIRLSDKANGYVLSYRGQDRCRHFVIIQDRAGQFFISGDDQPHSCLRDLIEHYKVSTIQPFGERLSSSCSQFTSDELYDVVQFGVKAVGGVKVQALKRYWDKQNEPRNGRSNQHQRSGQPHQRSDHHQRSDQHRQSDHHQHSDQHHQRSDQHHKSWNQQLNETWNPPAMPPMLPRKPRKLTSTASTGRMSVPQQAVPPVPRRGLPLTHSLSGTMAAKSSSQTLYTLTHHNHNLNHKTFHSHTLYALAHHDQNKTTSHNQTQYTEINRIQSKVESLASTGSLNQGGWAGPIDNTDPRYVDSCSTSSPAAGGVLYAQLNLSEDRSLSLPRWDDTMDEEGDHSFTTGSSYSSSSSKRVTCHTYSLQDPREPLGSSLDQPSTNPLYYNSVGFCVGKESHLGPQVHRKEGRGWGANIKAQQEDSMYAEVPQSPPLIADNTYEQIPGDGGLKGTRSSGVDQQWNTYETLEELKSQESTRGIKDIPWRKLFPEYKKK